MKRILCIIIAALMLLSLTSCANGSGGSGENDDGKNGDNSGQPAYVITRADQASDGVIDAAKTLRSALVEAGVDIKLSTDWYKDESEIPGYEILVGDTNRSESATVKDSLDDGENWKIQKVGTKIVIAGRSDASITSAVNVFIEEYIKKETTVIYGDINISGKDHEDNSLIEFTWADGTISVIARPAWGPRVYTMSNGNLIAGYETSQGIKTMISINNAKNWKSEEQASFFPSRSCANVNFFELDGKVYLAYRATGSQADGSYTSLQVSVSEDFGKSWKHHSTIVENVSNNGRGVWEPCLGEINGVLTVLFADERNTGLQNISMMKYNESSGNWGGFKVISDGNSHNSRDGMPVWIKLSGGDYACVIESSRLSGNGYPFIIQLLYSEDGDNWSEPVDIYRPTTRTSKAGAPGIAELPTGQIVVSFQTDEDQSEKGDKTSVMKTIISNGKKVSSLRASSFTESDNVFGTPDGEGSIWTGIWYADGYLYAAAGTSSGASLNKIQLR